MDSTVKLVKSLALVLIYTGCATTSDPQKIQPAAPTPHPIATCTRAAHNWVFSFCLYQALPCKDDRESAQASTNFFRVRSHLTTAQQEHLLEVLDRFLAQEYQSFTGDELHVMKCIDLLDSEELDKLTPNHEYQDNCLAEQRLIVPTPSYEATIVDDDWVPYSQQQIDNSYFSWALASCFAEHTNCKTGKHDAGLAAAGYLERGELGIETYEEIRNMISKRVKSQREPWIHECLYFYESRELGDLIEKHKEAHLATHP